MATGRCISLLILRFFNGCMLLIVEFIYTKLEDFVKLGLHFIRLCGSIVPNPIIYRLVPSPSWYEMWKCGLREDVQQRDMPNAVTKRIFKTFQGLVNVNITGNFWSLPSEDHRWVMATEVLFYKLQSMFKSLRLVVASPLKAPVCQDTIGMLVDHWNTRAFSSSWLIFDMRNCRMELVITIET